MKLSVVTPIHNEAESIPLFYDEITKALKTFSGGYEVVAVDDGSTDKSWEKLRTIAQRDTTWKPIRLRTNQGQTAALMAGIHNAIGGIIITIDSDLENDPADILKLVSALESSDVDIVSGWREDRWKDHGLSRRLPSRIANWLISRITGLELHDHGCTLKAYKREVFEGIELYGDMHRFVAAYLSWRGARVTEISVAHRSRQFGASHYGISRTFRVLLDLIVMKFLNKYMNHPMRFFGGIGFMSFLLGFIAGITAIILKLLDVRDFVDTPLPIFSALLIIVGVQLIVMGILAEMLMRTYYESQGKKPYVIAEKLNFS
jgi:glycosyltransferase involved in cell wall biosynthesis